MTKKQEKKARRIKATTANSYEDPYRPMRHKEKYKGVPRCIYFYYVYDDSGSVKARHYYYVNANKKIKLEDLPHIIRDLTINGRIDGKYPPKDGVNFKHMVWRRKSYLAAVVDITDSQLTPGDAIEFLRDTRYNPNHTFFDAGDFEVDVPPISGSMTKPTAVYCINHMKRDDGGADLDYEPQDFRFQLNYGARRPIVPDDGGTNMGPPVPPP